MLSSFVSLCKAGLKKTGNYRDLHEDSEYHYLYDTQKTIKFGQDKIKEDHSRQAGRPEDCKKTKTV